MDNKETHDECCEKPNAEQFRKFCEESLRSSGARITRPRRLVIDALSVLRKPVTAASLYESLGDSKLDRVTVYRILDTLYNLGLVHKVTHSGEFLPCSHLSCSGVHHVITHCVHCNKVNEIEVPEATVGDLYQYLRGMRGFQPETHVLHIDGTCKNCTK